MTIKAAHMKKALGAVGALGGQLRSYSRLAAGANKALAQAPAGLTTQGAAAFLATLGVESAYFRTTKEYGTGQWYAPWIGRSFVQVTHRDNYAAFGTWCHRKGLLDDAAHFTRHPAALEAYQWAWLGGIWYFETTGLWRYANRGDFRAVSQGVNGGMGTVGTGFTPYGWTERQAMYRAFLSIGSALLPGAKQEGSTMAVTANGWPQLASFPATFAAPTGQVCPVANDDLAVIFAYVAWRMHTEVCRPMTSAYGGRTIAQQRAVYAAQGKPPDMWSNHISGTACDFARPGVAYELFQTGAYKSGYTRAEEAQIRRICTDTGVMQWGGDYPAGVRDPVHIQVRGNLSAFGQRPISAGKVKAEAKRIRAWVQRVQVSVDAEPDGFAGPGTVQAVKDWQADQGLTVDGIFGPASQTAAGWFGPPPSKGILGMSTYKNTPAYKAKQTLTRMKWRTVAFGRSQYSLLVADGKPWLVEVDLRASGLEPGDTLQVRYIIVNYRGKGHKTTRDVTYKIDERRGSTGSTFVHVFQMGSPGKGKAGISRRLRVQALTTGKNVTITSANAKILKD